MGAWVAQRRGSEVYTVGIVMGRGVGTWNNRTRYEIKRPDADTLEAVLANAGRQITFVDFSGAERKPGTEWIFEPIASLAMPPHATVRRLQLA